MEQSMYITRKAEPARRHFGKSRAEKDWFWYCDVSVYKNIRIRASTRIPIHSVYRNLHSGERIQKISGYTERIQRTRVDASCMRIKKFADTKISGYVWTGPYGQVLKRTTVEKFASKKTGKKMAKEKVKALGVWFPMDQETTMPLNYDEKRLKIKYILGCWRFRIYGTIKAIKCDTGSWSMII